MANAQDFILVDNDGKRVAIGDWRDSHNGGRVQVSGFQPPRHEGSTGRVDLRNEQNEYIGQFYPSVVGLSIQRNTEKRTATGFQIRWFDGFGGKPDYSAKIFDTVKDAEAAAELACESCGDVAFEIVFARTHRKATNVGVYAGV